MPIQHGYLSFIALSASEQRVGFDWVADTPYTVKTTRAPAMLAK